MPINYNAGSIAKAKAKARKTKQTASPERTTHLTPDEAKDLAHKLIAEHNLAAPTTESSLNTMQIQLDMVSRLINQSKEKSTK
ncbi:hypothetical protein SAMN05216206_2584 [Pseudomonas guineae]|uniref:Uncharacterized protein n=1 Tax=Pseudomonas guineae TaxID=425504 RepID=A0A1I3JRE5_9PSED|nr:hypothetical protein [Pseudomonas guineae]SFI62744.1 hypothetical protein SAMN05216206_2584 [Pseudomonas guineae]